MTRLEMAEIRRCTSLRRCDALTARPIVLWFRATSPGELALCAADQFTFPAICEISIVLDEQVMVGALM